MPKFMTTIVLLFILYALPLIAVPYRIADPRILFLLVAGAVMFISQPGTSGAEVQKHKGTDGLTFYLIIGAGSACQICGIAEWAYLHNGEDVRHPVVTAVGVLMVVAGMSFRVWAIAVNKWFTAVVRVQEGQKIIQAGPYRLVRHPSYLGAFSAIVGSSLVLEAPMSCVISSCIMLVVYYFRITREEIALVGELKEQYTEYRRVRKYRLIPLVW